MTTIFDVLAGPVGVLLGVLANVLPRRVTREWEGRLPLAGTAVLSGLLTLFLGMAIGIPGFLRHASESASRANEAMLELAGRQMAHPSPGVAPVSTALPVSLSALSLFTFLFLTPWGLLALYLGLSGVYRAVAAATGDLRGDPLLSVLDGVHHRRRAAARNDRVARARERAEGSAVPDVLLRGADAGVPDALYVLVASRRKDGWEPGVFVVTPLQWYRIGPAFDRRFPRGLRTLYPLHEVGAVEVLRRSVAYDLPRLSAIDPATLETSILPDPAPGEE